MNGIELMAWWVAVFGLGAWTGYLIGKERQRPVSIKVEPTPVSVTVDYSLLERCMDGSGLKVVPKDWRVMGPKVGEQ